MLLDRGTKSTMHPVRKYLAGLKWDGVPRLEKLCVEYVGAADTPLNRAYGKAWAISAVRRVRRPGSKADQMLILNGKQGAGKSQFFRILAGDDWFNDSLKVGVDAKAVIEGNSGKWIAECAELDGMAKSDTASVKAFQRRQSDYARTAYARNARDVPRQFVLVGTTNEATFLRDETGNRTAWIVNVGDMRLDDLIKDRDQIWAEAAWCEAEGESSNIPAVLWAEQARTAEQHLVKDEVTETVSELLRTVPRDCRVSNDALYLAVGITEVAKRNGIVSRAIGNAARRLGWTNKFAKIDGKSQRVWVTDDEVPNAKLFVFDEFNEVLTEYTPSSSSRGAKAIMPMHDTMM